MAKLPYRLASSQVAEILCHSLLNEKEQYLVRWKSTKPREAVLSWHTIPQLAYCVDLLEHYVEQVQSRQNLGPLSLRKRKSPHDEVTVASTSSTFTPVRGESPSRPSSTAHAIYNGRLRAKAGVLSAFEVSIKVTRHPKSSGEDIVCVDATQMPDAELIAIANNTPIVAAVVEIRNAFLLKLSKLQGPRVSYSNTYDTKTPSLAFTFTDEWVFGEGVEPALDDILVGCQKCKPHVGRHIGCELTQRCDCLELAMPDPSGLRATDSEDTKQRLQQWQDDPSSIASTDGLPKRFPYVTAGPRKGCLERFYLDSRYTIYECNSKCACGPNCKSRNVQHGRRIELEIFRTGDARGFGLRTKRDVQRGEFIDKYVGELITDAEATRRESSAPPGKASYLFALDKFADDTDGPLQIEDCYVADGEFVGGPTRFINHSCEPNCRLFTVSYNKNDLLVYDLAFFAIDDIKAETELTFDYKDKDEDEDEDDEDDFDDDQDEELDAAAAATEKQTRAERIMKGKDDKARDDGKTKVPCKCGARRCRGFLWE